MDHDLDPLARLRNAAAHTTAPELDPALVTNAADRRAPHLVRRGRVARGAGIGVTALAAVSVTALVMGNPFAAPAPLFAAAGSSGNATAGMMAEDARIALWVDYDYRAGAGLSNDGGRGDVYELRRSGDPEALARAAAAALGLEGTAVESSYSTPDYPSYVVGPEDGSAPSLTLSWMGTGDWWYNDPAAYPEPVCQDVTFTNDDGTEGSYQDCRVPEVPASESKAPSEAEARELAATLFAATGLDVAPADIRVTIDSSQSYANASLEIDGVATALEWSVGWSPLGRIAWASGHAVEVVERGGYDTVSPASAVDRLEDGRWFGAAGPDYSGGAVMYAADGLARAGSPDGAVSSDGGATTEPGSTPGAEPAPDAGGGSSAVPGDPGSIEPAPADPDGEPTILPEPEPQPEPLPTPETVTVTLERAESTLLLVWDVDGNAWLVPGYAYEQPEQGFWTSVISLVEGVIQLPEPFTAEILPAEEAQ
ncbi:MAG: hypothetical protein ACTHMQ_09155 [Protaetiibacter sp.]